MGAGSGRPAPIAALAAVLRANQEVIHITHHIDVNDHWYRCPHVGCVRARDALANAGQTYARTDVSWDSDEG